MGSARTVPKYASKRGAYCATEDDLIPPGMRLLLNSFAPKQIKEIQSDQDATTWEKAALGLLADEDQQTKVGFQKISSVEINGAYVLSGTSTGHDLMPRDVRLLADELHVAGPNVDITQRTPPAELSAPHTGVHNVHRLYLSAAFRLLLGKGGNTGVAALIVSSQGQILAWGKKNSDHPLLHAETSALLMYGRRLPAGTRIYSTLKPCKMCRAAIEHFSTENDFLAYYGQDDPTAAASGRVDSAKYVHMAHTTTVGERPVWDLKSTGIKRSVSFNLNDRFDTAHSRDRSLGIIDFIKGERQTSQLNMAAGYLAIKQRKYTDPKRSDPTLSDRYNTNVEKCLDHIVKVMAQLGIPVLRGK
ncbi:Bd3614 family nucleic acid deaminase [Paraburkholderia atlantica]|nr:Bd3614 family nucleic acid deaminase [Paraburkholderia atlantica]MBB5508007.1 tRNA(Arg) A34 adenosine deaminase TadA [Paraburkholderia atlantica]